MTNVACARLFSALCPMHLRVVSGDNAAVVVTLVALHIHVEGKLLRRAASQGGTLRRDRRLLHAGRAIRNLHGQGSRSPPIFDNALRFAAALTVQMCIGHWLHGRSVWSAVTCFHRPWSVPVSVRSSDLQFPT